MDIFRRKSIHLMLLADDGGNVLRASYADDMIKILGWITDEVYYDENNNHFTYRNICLKFQNDCYLNHHARLIADIFRNGDQVLLQLLVVLENKRKYLLRYTKIKFRITLLYIQINWFRCPIRTLQIYSIIILVSFSLISYNTVNSSKLSF